jgi:hypothetical protein
MDDSHAAQATTERAEDAPLGVARIEHGTQGASAIATSEPRARRGRPRGLPKTGGRRKGQPNFITKDMKEAIIASRGNPVAFLLRIIEGQRIRVGPLAGPAKPQFEYPTLADRIRAAMALAQKILPDMKATELSGPGGAPVEVMAIDVEERAEQLREIGRLLREQPVTPPPSLRSPFPDPEPPAIAVSVDRPAKALRADGLRTRTNADDPTIPPGFSLEEAERGWRVLRDGKLLFPAFDYQSALSFVSYPANWQ